jgi:hypothetical protein
VNDKTPILENGARRPSYDFDYHVRHAESLLLRYKAVSARLIVLSSNASFPSVFALEKPGFHVNGRPLHSAHLERPVVNLIPM